MNEAQSLINTRFFLNYEYLNSNMSLGKAKFLGKNWEPFGKFLGNLYSVVFKE